MRKTPLLLGLIGGLCLPVIHAQSADAQDLPPPASPDTPDAPGAPTPMDPTGTEYDTPTEIQSAPTATDTTTTSQSTTTFGTTSATRVDETMWRFPNRPLLTTGGAVFITPYLATVIYQAAEDRNRNLYIPVAGPWLDFARGGDGRGARTLLAVDGALQAAGAFGVLLSLAVPERRTRNWYLIGGRRQAFQVNPARFGQDSLGVLAHGQF